MIAGAARVGQQLALIADQAAGRRVEHQPLAAAAGRAHLDHLGLALGHLLHDDAGMLLVDVDDDLLDRLQQLAGRLVLAAARRAGATPTSSKPSRRMVSIRMPSCNSPRPETSIASLSSDSRRRAARRCLRLRAAGGRGSRGSCTLSPSVPASGESLTRKVIDSGRRIDRLRRQRLVDRGIADRVGDGAPSAGRRWRRCRRPRPRRPAVRSRPRKASTLVTRPCLDQLAVAAQHLDRLVRLDRAGRDAAGEDAAEIGVGFQHGAEHAERAFLDRRRRHVAQHQVEQRRHAVVLRAVRAVGHPAVLGPSRRGSGSRAARRWRRARRTGRTPR